MMRAAALLVVACAAALAASVPAAADQAFEAVQIVCLPKAQVFSASRRWIWDIAANFDQRSDTVSLVAPESLRAHSFECSWEGYHVKVAAPAAKSFCAAQSDTSLEATLNGKPLACLAGSERADDDTRRSVTVNGEGAGSHVYSVITETCSVLATDIHQEDADMMMHCKSAVVNDFAEVPNPRK